MTEAMKKEKEKTISKIDREQLKDVGDQFPEITEISEDIPKDESEASEPDDRDSVGSEEEIEPIVKDSRFSRGHEIDEQALRKNKKETDTTKELHEDEEPDVEPEEDSEETE